MMCCVRGEENLVVFKHTVAACSRQDGIWPLQIMLQVSEVQQEQVWEGLLSTGLDEL